MYHDQVVGFEQIFRSTMSKEDGWVKILDSYYVDGPHRIFLIITKREYLIKFFWPKTYMKAVLLFFILYHMKIR